MTKTMALSYDSHPFLSAYKLAVTREGLFVSHLTHRTILCHWQVDWHDAEEESEFENLSVRSCSQRGNPESGSKSLIVEHPLSTKHGANTGPCEAGVENM